MIRELKINNPERTPISWWSKVEALKGRESIEFNPDGPTILFGPNGSGKSTIIKALAILTHCEQGGTPKITDTSIRNFAEFREELKDGLELVSDGQPTHYMAPDLDAGLVGGGAGFDWDFGRDGLDSMFASRSSSGQQVTYKLNRLMASATTLTKVEGRRELREGASDTYRDTYTLAMRGMSPTPGVEPGLKTLLMDEPLRSLDITSQVSMWDALPRKLFKEYQVIVATHSPFALNIQGALYIDLEPGYVRNCKEDIGAFIELNGAPWELGKRTTKMKARKAPDGK